MVFRQLDPGTYTVKIADSSGVVQVGWCFVEGTGQNTTVEHYALHSTYDPPGSSEGLRLAHAPSDSYESTSEFFSAMHEEEPSNAPYIYIRAVCTKYSVVP